MCGIAGIYEFDRAKAASATLLQRMTDLIAHRGPDDAGQYVAGGVALGHRRLSIIDPTPAGHQPMANEDSSIWIVYNGECYNYADFRAPLEERGHRFHSSSDTETLLHLYEEYGPELLSRIDGMFAFAIWDARRQRLLLARDRLGIKPLFYFADATHFTFASELKSLLADPAVSGRLDPAAWSEFLHLMSTPGAGTIFCGVRKLLPGHYLCVVDGRISEHRYWEVPMWRRLTRMSLDEACEQFDRIFRKAVTSHLVSDVPVGVFLSGGVDSSAVAALAAREAQPRMQSFSIGFKGVLEFDESAFAKQVAAHVGTDHRELNMTPDLVEELPRVVWHADEPFAISSSLALYCLARLTRQYVKVVLSGDGGDEVFAGYPWRHQSGPSRHVPLPARMRRLVGAILGPVALNSERRSAGTRVLDRMRRALSLDEGYVESFCVYQTHDLHDLLTPETFEAVSLAWETNVAQEYYDRYPRVDQLRRKLYTDLKSTLVSEMLTKVDRMTMAFGLEARVPLLDYHLIEWAFEVPGELKIQAAEGKLLVKKAMEKYLPHELLYRPKHGFNVPLKLWMRAQLRDYTRDILTERTIRSRGLFRPEAVERILRQHEEGTADASNKIFTLLVTELWFRWFIDGRDRIIHG